MAPVDLSALTPEQRGAVRAPADRDLLIRAGPGAGKTKALTYRIAHVVAERGLPPQSVLAVSFTNKAVAEMRDRLVQLMGQRGQLVVASTVHSFGNRLAGLFRLTSGRLEPEEMIAVPLQALRRGHPLGAFLRRQVRHVFIDEAQDCSREHAALVGWIAAGDCRLTAAGDDDQAIFAMLPGAPAVGLGWVAAHSPRLETCWLHENHRSTPEIVRLANALLGRAAVARRPPGPLPQLLVARDEWDEADWIAAEIALLRHRQLARAREVVILLRYKQQAWLLRRGLARRAVPVDMRLEEYQQPDDRPGAGVTITTIHRSKAGEWPVVFVPGLDDGTIPGRLAETAFGLGRQAELQLAAERRLLFVAISRPHERLYLSYPEARARGDRLIPTEPSRFLDAFPRDGVLERRWAREGRPPVRF